MNSDCAPTWFRIEKYRFKISWTFWAYIAKKTADSFDLRLLFCNFESKNVFENVVWFEVDTMHS